MQIIIKRMLDTGFALRSFSEGEILASLTEALAKERYWLRSPKL